MASTFKTLLFSTLYPSSIRPVHGVFVETRLRELLKSGRVQSKVVAPVPWFPSSNPAFGSYAKMAATPRFEQRNGLEVFHPRYFLPPKIGQNIAPYVLAAGALPTIRKIIRDGFDFDLIDAHFYYPDGVAASIIAEKIGKPFICTARGSDINLYRQFKAPASFLRSTIAKASANIGVCRDLAEQLIELGADSEQVHSIRNGVDLQRFFPVDRSAARQALGIKHSGMLWISVGNLIELKGHHLLVDMLAARADAHLLIVGAGPMRAELEARANSLGVADRLQLVGQQPNDKLHLWFSAADVTFLASSREGWANVLLESMASGTPVVATAVNGTPEVVASADAGQLAKSRDVPGLMAAFDRLLASYPDRAATRRYAEGFSWEETTQQQLSLFGRVCGGKD